MGEQLGNVTPTDPEQPEIHFLKVGLSTFRVISSEGGMDPLTAIEKFLEENPWANPLVRGPENDDHYFSLEFITEKGYRPPPDLIESSRALARLGLLSCSTDGSPQIDLLEASCQLPLTPQKPQLKDKSEQLELFPKLKSVPRPKKAD